MDLEEGLLVLEVVPKCRDGRLEKVGVDHIRLVPRVPVGTIPLTVLLVVDDLIQIDPPTQIRAVSTLSGHCAYT